MMRRLTALMTVLLFALGLPLVMFTDLATTESTQPAQHVSLPPSASPAVLAAQTESTLGAVTKVVDGDTIKVQLGDKVETVRLVGINTPETVDPRRPVECMGKQASERLKSLVMGAQVRLESDPTQTDRDRYGRLLRFVFLEDGTDVGKVLLMEGLAQEALYSHEPHRYRQDYLLAQTIAQEVQSGLWQPGICD